jgi:hypothetical protein
MSRKIALAMRSVAHIVDKVGMQYRRFRISDRLSARCIEKYGFPRNTFSNVCAAER